MVAHHRSPVTLFFPKSPPRDFSSRQSLFATPIGAPRPPSPPPAAATSATLIPQVRSLRRRVHPSIRKSSKNKHSAVVV